MQFFIHSPIYKYVNCFQFGAIISNAAIDFENFYVYINLYFFWVNKQSRIAGSKGKSIDNNFFLMQNLISKWLQHLIFLSTMYESSAAPIITNIWCYQYFKFRPF